MARTVYIHTAYDRAFGEFPNKDAVCIPCVYVGLARTINIRCIYGNFGREFTRYTVMYGVYIQF